MKALEKDRNRRYDTPGNFAEDIERYLRHEAILARPPSTLYKLRKFAQRNRAAVLTAAAVAAALDCWARPSRPGRRSSLPTHGTRRPGSAMPRPPREMPRARHDSRRIKRRAKPSLPSPRRNG